MAKRSLQSTGMCQTPSTHGLVAAGAAMIAVTYGWIRFGYGLYLPQLETEFSLSSQLAGLIGSASFVAYCAAALTARSLIGRCGARRVLWLAAGLGTVGAIVVAAAWSATVLAFGVLVAGSAAGAASPALVVALAATVPQRSAARAQAIVNGGTGAGVVVAGIAALLIPATWRLVWVAAAIAVLIAAAAVDRQTRWPPPTPTAAASGTENEDLHTPPAPLRRPVLAATLAGIGSAAMWTFGRDLLTNTGGLPERTTAALWVLLGVAAVGGALSGDIIRLVGLRRSWVLTAALSAIGTAVFSLAAPHVLLAGMAGALFGCAYTALSGVLIAWANALRPQLVGATTATLFIALAAGQALGSTLTGAVAGQLGPIKSFLLCAGLLLAAAAILPPQHQQNPSSRHS